jgi:single-strand DNA-binding protein
LHNQNPETHAHAFVYGYKIIAETVDFLSSPKSAENEDPKLVDRDDEIPF